MFTAHTHTHTSDVYSGDEEQGVLGRDVEGILIEFAQQSSGEWK